MHRFWKLIKVLNILNCRFSEVCHPTEQLAVHEVTVFFKGKVTFRIVYSHIQKKKRDIWNESIQTMEQGRIHT
jgi:hypothetical protein